MSRAIGKFSFNSSRRPFPHQTFQTIQATRPLVLAARSAALAVQTYASPPRNCASMSSVSPFPCLIYARTYLRPAGSVPYDPHHGGSTSCELRHASNPREPCPELLTRRLFHASNTSHSPRRREAPRRNSGLSLKRPTADFQVLGTCIFTESPWGTLILSHMSQNLFLRRVPAASHLDFLSYASAEPFQHQYQVAMRRSRRLQPHPLHTQLFTILDPSA